MLRKSGESIWSNLAKRSRRLGILRISINSTRILSVKSVLIVAGQELS